MPLRACAVPADHTVNAQGPLGEAAEAVLAELAAIEGPRKVRAARIS